MKYEKGLRIFALAGLSVLVVTVVSVLAQQVTLTSFYPAPFGEYRQLSVVGDPPIAPATVADPDPTVDVTIGTAAAGAITQNGTVQINGNVTIGQAGDGANRDRSLTVSGNATVGDPTPFPPGTSSTVTVNGQLTVDDNIPGLGSVVAQHDVTIGDTVSKDAVLNVWGEIRVNNQPLGFSAPNYDSGTAPIGTIAGCGVPCRNGGWVSINPGTTVTFTHTFNTLDYLIYIEGRGGGANVNQRFYGGDVIPAGVDRGAHWENKTTTAVSVVRHTNDIDWGEIRVRLWCWSC